MAEQLHVDDARAYLIRFLAHLQPGQRTKEHELWVHALAQSYWRDRSVRLDGYGPEAETRARPFYDAAWELCRIGVLRPGMVAGLGSEPHFTGDGYTLTPFGREWVRKVAEDQPPPTDPARFAQVMAPFRDRFGPGFMQRATEAAACYQTGNYLACCVMAGGAGEAILLATAIAKTDDEAKVLGEYRAASGRARTIDRIAGSARAGLREQFKTGCELLSFWRDDAAHGTATTISEIEAFHSLGQLLRFTQLVNDQWGTLTARSAPS